tara:strand:+ start:350 stop:649 length:300 start_codon:yes stop_codon:yes gene_type:complete
MDISKNIPLLIPLFLIIMFSCSHEIMTLFSYSLLGKLFSILLIIYYINLDIYVGITVAILFAYYYSREEYVYLLGMEEGFFWNMMIDRGDVSREEIVNN